MGWFDAESYDLYLMDVLFFIKYGGVTWETFCTEGKNLPP